MSLFRKATGAAPPVEEGVACCSDGDGRQRFIAAQFDKKSKGAKKPVLLHVGAEPQA